MSKFAQTMRRHTGDKPEWLENALVPSSERSGVQSDDGVDGMRDEASRAIEDALSEVENE